MSRVEGYSDDDVITVAKAAVQSKRDGLSVKEIEQFIRRGRMTGEW